MKKFFLPMLLVFSTMFSLAGCGDDDEMPEEGEEIEEISKKKMKLVMSVLDCMMQLNDPYCRAAGTSVNIDDGFVGTL